MSRVLVNGQDVNYTSDFPEMTYDKWKALPEDLRPNYTVITDRDYTGEPIDNSVSVTADGVKTWRELFNSLWALIDANKVTNNSYITEKSSTYYKVYNINSSMLNASITTEIRFSRMVLDTSMEVEENWSIKSSSSTYFRATNGTFADWSTNVPTAGIVITLHYTSINKVIESCDAEDVSYGSGTVKSALDDIAKHAFGQDVDLASYSTSSNKFTVPTDGYIYVASTDLTSSSPDYRLDVRCGYFVLCSLSKNIQRITTFVRKGMQIYYTNYYYSVGTNCFIQYTPLV